MISPQLLAKLNIAYSKGSLDLEPGDAYDSLVFIIEYQIRHSTLYFSQLQTLVGKPEGITDHNKLVEYYCKGLYNLLLSKNKVSEQLFWRMLKSMIG